MAKYRRKLSQVEAFQWTGQLGDFPDWANRAIGETIRLDGLALQVDTNHGSTRVNRGDWVLFNGDDIYPATDVVFKKNYEPVTTETPG